MDYSDSGTNAADMEYVDVDNVSDTFNSSSANLTFSTENGADPNCSSIVYAGLYWTGRASNGTSSPNIFDVTKDVPGNPIPVNNNQTVGHTDNIDFSNFALSVSREGGTNNRYSRFTFTGNGNSYRFDFTNNTGANRVQLSVNGGGFVNVPVNYSTSGSTGIAVLNTPYEIIDGTVTITISELRRPTSSNSNTSTYLDNSFAEVNVNGTTTSTTTITKTFDKRKVKFKGPNSANYTTITANPNDIYYPTNSDGFMYSGYADVTSYVQQNGLGEYFVADIALVEGNGGGTGYYGGWGLVVVYENDLMNYRDVTVFDGHSYVAGSITADFEIPVSGFNTALAGPINMKLGMMAGEGDRGISGDFFQIRNANNTSWETLNHGGNSSNNFFNSSIFTGGNTRNPNLLNNTGMDVSMFDVNNPGNTIIGNNQTSTRFRYGTTQDTYVIFNITMSVDAYVPETEAIISATNINGVPASLPLEVEPGQEMEFEVDLLNLGTEPIDNYQVKIPIPFASSYVPGSATSSIFFAPAPSPNLISFDPNMGPNGTLIWDLGTLPLPVITDDVLGTLKFKLKATEDCLLLLNPGCITNIPINGTVTGVGGITGVPLNSQEFIQGYEDGTCLGQTISAPVFIDVLPGDFVAQNCQQTSIETAFTLCSQDSSVPVSVISDSFPLGSIFYDQFPGGSPITSFPVNQNITTYYALPAGGAPNSCVFEFTIEFFCGDPEIELLKSGAYVDTNNDNIVNVGDQIEYTFTVENTGNLLVTNIVINDATIGVANLAITPSDLAPGQTGTATYFYSITQADIDAGGVYNIALATGQDPNGDDVEDESEDPNPLDPGDPNYDPNCPDCTFTELPQDPSIEIIKSADPSTYSAAGDVITYTLTVTNTGNVT
ncbi:MAG: hypothetical protein NXH73_10240, partial [Flavobacteriaceae bacterium]|nr:hypothetical protein [Flavobacteriaceae bacterium]